MPAGLAPAVGGPQLLAVASDGPHEAVFLRRVLRQLGVGLAELREAPAEKVLEGIRGHHPEDEPDLLVGDHAARPRHVEQALEQWVVGQPEERVLLAVAAAAKACQEDDAEDCFGAVGDAVWIARVVLCAGPGKIPSQINQALAVGVILEKYPLFLAGVPCVEQVLLDLPFAGDAGPLQGGAVRVLGALARGDFGDGAAPERALSHVLQA